MRYCIFVCFLGVLFFACGSKQTSKKTQDKKPDTTLQVKKEPVQDKSYLKKRPEEFKEFFMLTDVVPFTGKVAKKKDVKNKLAVFNLDSKGDTSHRALKITLPFFAFLKQKGNKPSVYVSIMQAEVLKKDTILGYKQANGLFGICKPRELEYFESQREKVYQTKN